MQNKTLKQLAPMVRQFCGEKKSLLVMRNAENRLQELIRENKSDPKAIRSHTVKEIFPCISLYESLQSCGIAQKEALSFLDKSWSRRAQRTAAGTKKLLRIRGLYKLYPAMFRWSAKNQFGAAAGFEAKFYDCGRYRCKFDMTRCLFLATCRRYGCPELTQCFCHTDDILNAGLHPALAWKRTQFMGCGGKLCDFDIGVKTRENL